MNKIKQYLEWIYNTDSGLCALLVIAFLVPFGTLVYIPMFFLNKEIYASIFERKNVFTIIVALGISALCIYTLYAQLSPLL